MSILSFSRIYIYADIVCLTLLLLSLYFAVFSFLPVMDMRKTDKRKSLALMFLYTGLGIKLVLLFYWYFLMQGVVLKLPSARCIMGVLGRIGGMSWLLAVLKIFSFPAMLYCLSLRYIDVEMKYRPFKGIRIWAIFFAAPLLLFETFIDIIVQKKIVVLIHGFTSKIFSLHIGTPWGKFLNYPYFWIIVYVLSCTGLLVMLYLMLKYSDEDSYLFNTKKLFSLQVGVAMVSLCVTSSFLLAIHNELCPMILDLKNHFCMFCLLQYSFDMPWGLLLVLIGFGFSFSLGFMPGLKSAGPGAAESRGKSIFVDKYQGIVKIAFITTLFGLIITIIRLISVLF